VLLSFRSKALSPTARYRPYALRHQNSQSLLHSTESHNRLNVNKENPWNFKFSYNKILSSHRVIEPTSLAERLLFCNQYTLCASFSKSRHRKEKKRVNSYLHVCSHTVFNNLPYDSLKQVMTVICMSLITVLVTNGKIGVGWLMLLKWICRDPWYGRVAGSCKHGNELSVSINCEGFLHKLGNY
jgi:hypothetical protein